MKIECEACHAKYTVPDEKVRGKAVKVRCKNCSAPIVATTATTESATSTDAAFCVALPSGDAWLQVSEIAGLHLRGEIDDATFIWAEGWADWVPLSTVSAITDAIRFAKAEKARNDSAPGKRRETLRPAMNLKSLAGNSSSQQPKQDERRAAIVKRGEGRERRDLFASMPPDALLAKSRSNELASIEASAARTGERNENSVLFSLATLTTVSPSSSKDKGGSAGDHSGIIDLAPLMNKASSEAALPVAPLFSPPTPQEVFTTHIPSVVPAAKNRRVVFGGIAAGAFALVIGIFALSGEEASAKVSRNIAEASTPLSLAESALRAPPRPAEVSPSVSSTTGSGRGTARSFRGNGRPAKAAAAAAAPAPKVASDPCHCNGELMCLIKCSAKSAKH